jgi:thiamine biosynthesis lipoprotein
VRVAGDGPDGEAWTVAVEHEWATAPIALLGLADGAVATSTTLRRRWQSSDGRVRHHLIDPQTGLPSDTDVNTATVVAASAWAAEVLAKAVLLRGSALPFAILGGTGAQGLAVVDDGRILATDGLAAYLGDAHLPAVVEPSRQSLGVVRTH